MNALRPTPQMRFAAYLRCFPSDLWGMAGHVELLRDYGRRSGLLETAIFLDNGCASRKTKPQLDQLIASASSGLFQVVLVPGLWVFSVQDQKARHIAQSIETRGCRVIDVPRPRVFENRVAPLAKTAGLRHSGPDGGTSSPGG